MLLRIKPRTLNMSGKTSTTDLYPQIFLTVDFHFGCVPFWGTELRVQFLLGKHSTQAIPQLLLFFFSVFISSSEEQCENKPASCQRHHILTLELISCIFLLLCSCGRTSKPTTKEGFPLDLRCFLAQPYHLGLQQHSTYR